MQTKNMSQSIEPEQSATDQCDGSSTELSKAMATLSVNTTGTNTASKQFSIPPASSTTPFGSSGSVSGPPLFGTSSTPPSGSSSLFHVASKPASGVGTSSALLSVTGTSESGVKSSPLFGVPKTPASCSQSSLFGAPKTSAFGGAPSTPLFGPSGTPASPSPGFGLFGASSSPTFGASNKPAFGTSSSPSFGTPSSIPNALQHDPFHVSAKPAFTSSAHPFGASGNPGCWPSGTPNCGMSKPPFNTSTTFQLPTSSNPGFSASGSLFGTSHTSSQFGGFSKTNTTGGFGSTSTPAFGFGTRPFEGYSGPYFGMSCTSCAGRRDLQLPISGFASWSPFWKDPVRLSSICAMLACSNVDMSYEHLRWCEYCRRNRKGESNKSAHVNRIGDTDSDLITIKIKVPSQVATQLLEAIRALHINGDSSSTSHGQSAPVFGIPFSLATPESSAV